VARKKEGIMLKAIVCTLILSSACLAQEIEVITPVGKVTVRIRPIEEREEIDLFTPSIIGMIMLEDIRLLRTHYVPKLKRERDRIEASSVLNELEDLTNLLLCHVNVDDSVPVDTVIPPEPMDEKAFALFLSQLKEESFSDNKLKLARTVASDNLFLVGQLCQIMQCFDFEEGKVDAVRTIYPKVIDRENAFKLLEQVEFSNSKEEIEKIIGQ
jgi:hypothetical protein